MKLKTDYNLIKDGMYMAKQSQSISFRNAVLNADDMTITEYEKDETKVYDLMKVLREFHGKDGLSAMIKLGDDRMPDGE